MSKIRDKAEVGAYDIISRACHRVEGNDHQWSSDPNHFLIFYVRQILSIPEIADALNLYEYHQQQFGGEAEDEASIC